jgi:hypothetical protein
MVVPTLHYFPTQSPHKLTAQRAVTGAGRHSENEPCRAMTTTDRHAARSHSLDDISTTFGENVIGLLCAY